MMESLGLESYDKLKSDLERVCSELASRFDLHDKSGRPRTATILDILAGSTCTCCITRNLSETNNSKRIDGIYAEVHKLAVSILIEEIYEKCSSLGYSVSILSEAQTKYGKVDVLIRPTRIGVALQHGATELIVEVKTGVSLSIPQIFRYLLDKENQTVILWRIRNRQVLTFSGTQFNALLRRYMKTCILRGQRLLNSTEQVSCKHAGRTEWTPTQDNLQEMLEDFSTALTETLPCVAKTILQKLGLGLDHKQVSTGALRVTEI
jgi:hypothetical protein